MLTRLAAIANNHLGGGKRFVLFLLLRHPEGGREIGLPSSKGQLACAVLRNSTRTRGTLVRMTIGRTGIAIHRWKKMTILVVVGPVRGPQNRKKLVCCHVSLMVC